MFIIYFSLTLVFKSITSLFLNFILNFVFFYVVRPKTRFPLCLLIGHLPGWVGFFTKGQTLLMGCAVSLTD